MLRADGRTYEWDEGKRATNLARHGIDFESIKDFRWLTATIKRSDRAGEVRHLAFGFLGDKVHAVVYTVRGDNRRLISMRRASKQEVKEHEERRRATDIPY